ncbi:MAG TPA: TonB-dependent receptor [Cyclobacteriaceae bacterium]|nr:TonB-dependent receptor [Cyclobacteriaceae bacterium]
MTKQLSLAFVLLLLSQLSWAQRPGNGKITGTVVEEDNNAPVEFATVALTEPDSNRPIDGTIVDAKGKFTLSKVPSGNFKLVISFIGFENIEVEVQLSEGKDNIDLGVIKMSSGSTFLKDVVIEGQRALIEERVDRTVYNAENDDTARGGDATDVLQRVPLLSVDFDGNVSLRGNSNVTVLINNKPSTIMASNVSDALRQIPAEQIKSVEVITSPSARYDAEGSAGIINIITKKSTLEGATLNINSSAGYRGSNLGLNGNIRKGKLGISLGGWGRANYNVQGGFSNEQTTRNANSDILVNTQRAETRNNNLFGNYNLGFDYDINKYNSLTGSVRVGARNGRSWQDGLLTETFINDQLFNSALRDVNTLDNSENLDLNLSYTKTFEKPQQELSVLALFSRNNRNNNFINSLINQNDFSVINRQLNENFSYNQEMTIQVDYQTPIKDNQILEVGAKQIARIVQSDFKFFFADGADGEFLPLTDSRLTNVLNYDQNVSATYLAYTYNTGKSMSFKGGARYEYTDIKANFSGNETIAIPAYGTLVPSLNASKRLTNGNTMKASYNRRIQRPSIRFLNPNLQASNPLNITVGNPSLDPEFTNNFELSYSMMIKGTALNLSGFARNTNNAIQSIRDVIGQDTIRTTFRNIGREDAYGMSAFASVTMGNLTLNGSSDVYYASLSNNDPNPELTASNQGWVISGRLFGTYKLKNDWALQAFGFYRGAQVQLQGYRGGFGVYSLSLNKSFAEKRGSFGIGAENFVFTPFKINSELTTPTISQRSTTELYNMNFKINFSYRIGKMSFDQRPRRRKSINNDDMKDGNGGDFMSMDAGQAQQGAAGATRAAMPAFSAGAGKPASRPATVADPAIPDADVSGSWTYVIEGQQPGTGEINLILEEGKYTGTIKSNMMRQEAELTDVSVIGNSLYFTYKVNFGGNEVLIEVNTTVEGENFEGTMSFGQFRTVPVKGQKKS